MLYKIFIRRIGIISVISTFIFIGGCFNKDNNQYFSNEELSQSHFKTDATLCQFQDGPCQQSFNELVVSFNMSPENAPSEKPLIIELTFSNNVENISSRIEGRDMFMGIIPVNLAETNKNHYQATVVYGSCSSNYMVWRMFVNFTYQGQQHSLWFDFLADNEPF